MKKRISLDSTIKYSLDKVSCFERAVANQLNHKNGYYGDLFIILSKIYQFYFLQIGVDSREKIIELSKRLLKLEIKHIHKNNFSKNIQNYSGNKGYPLPDDWAFDQIQETDNFYSSDGSFAIDKDVASGRYNGFNHFEKDKDDEWDLISEPCSAYVIASDDDTSTSVPVYWAKVKDADGNFKLKYTMDDYININSFFVLKEQNYALDRQNDSIRYVYFRDKGGSLNAGYIDFKSLSQFRVDTFQSCQTSVDDTGREKLHPYSKFYEFQVAKSIGYYDNSGNLLEKLPIGTIVKLPNNALTHKDYPNLIQVAYMKKPSSSGKTVTGYIDLGFEIGVTPKNRALITPSFATLTENKNKVIYFLPGYMGSQLYEKDSGDVAWVDIGTIALDIGQYRLSRDTILPATLKYGLILLQYNNIHLVIAYP